MIAAIARSNYTGNPKTARKSPWLRKVEGGRELARVNTWPTTP
jgi:hypothetical protein